MGFIKDRQQRAAVRKFERFLEVGPPWAFDARGASVSFNKFVQAMNEVMDADAAKDEAAFSKAASEAYSQLEVMEHFIGRIPLPAAAERVADLVALRAGFAEGRLPTDDPNAVMRIAEWVDQVSSSVP